MQNQLRSGAFILLAFIAVQVTVINGSPYSQNHYLTLKANQLKTQLDALKVIEKTKMKQMCYNVTGNNDAFTDLQLAQERSETCIKLAIHEAIIDSMESRPHLYYYYTSRESGVLQMVKAMCTKKETISQCQAEYIKEAAKCMDEKTKKRMKKSVKALDDLAKFLCDNNAEQIQSFFDNNGLQCLSQNADGVVECATNLSDDVASLVNPTSIATPQIDETKSCETAGTFFKCVVGKMKTCTNQTPATIGEKFFKQIMAAECDEGEAAKVETTNEVETF